MKRFVLGTLIVWSSAACVSGPVAPAVPSADPGLPRFVRVRFAEQGTTGARVEDVPLEEYVQATALSEVAPATGEADAVERMLEVQTIISRTYAVSHLGRHAREGFDLCATTHCQLFDPRRLRSSRWAAASAEAVSRTAGAILTFDRQPAQALFHADCGGYTSTSSSVWGGIDRPYLAARPDEGVARDAHLSWQYEVSLTDLTAALGLKGRLDTIAVMSRDDAGRAERIAVQSVAGKEARAASASVVIRGDEFRQQLTRAFGPRALRSTEIRRPPERRDVHVLGNRVRPRRRPVPGRRLRPATRRRHASRCRAVLLSRDSAQSRARIRGSGIRGPGGSGSFEADSDP